jgi:ferredoxin
MATMITSECINCGACEPECPNTAIYQGGVEWLGTDGAMHPALDDQIFYIVPEKCTECVGFHDQEACAAVCPVDCCVPNPQIVESHDLLLGRARALHPETPIPDDAPSRFKKEGAAAAPASAGAPAPAPVAPPAPAAALAPVAVAADDGLAMPSIEDWEIPIRCFRCSGEYTVPFENYRAGVVFRCPYCMSSLVPNLSMVRAVGETLEQFHATWSDAFRTFQAKRQRELAAFEEKQRRELAAFEERLKEIAVRERAAGAPVKRRGFFSF